MGHFLCVECFSWVGLDLNDVQHSLLFRFWSQRWPWRTEQPAVAAEGAAQLAGLLTPPLIARSRQETSFDIGDPRPTYSLLSSSFRPAFHACSIALKASASSPAEDRIFGEVKKLPSKRSLGNRDAALDAIVGIRIGASCGTLRGRVVSVFQKRYFVLLRENASRHTRP